MLKEFKGIEYSPFRVPCIFGYVHISTPSISKQVGEQTNFILISRKDWKRPGRRFIIRGLDADGNAANFVETEHILVHWAKEKTRVSSYVQTRGSIPLVWSMKPNLKWSPPVRIIQNFDYSRQAAETHFRDTRMYYGKQKCVNLIDKKGSQGRIGGEFDKLYADLKDPEIGYVWFDFHGECKKMKWENLSKLVALCKEELDSYGRFNVDLNVTFDDWPKLSEPNAFTVNSTQKGVMRTNCMDCLDRTNVV